mmetsp:Transcript_22250/g.32775  ORF Transcript_22250/g.32775 Transcript_22250/m.32775 type:complete len:224 (+) Transcript_22250:193-864(+)
MKSCAARRTMPPQKCPRSSELVTALPNTAISSSRAKYNSSFRQFSHCDTPATQSPFTHVSTPLQNIPSLHSESETQQLSGVSLTQVPVAGLQNSAPSQVCPLSSHVIGVPDTQRLRLLHVSIPLQGFPSLQSESEAQQLPGVSLTQVPVAGLQTSAPSQTNPLSGQVTGSPSRHLLEDKSHVSIPLQVFPSSQSIFAAQHFVNSDKSAAPFSVAFSQATEKPS